MLSYVSMLDPVYDKITKSIRATYPNSCIVEINSIKNDKEKEELFNENYEKECKSDKEKVDIIELFHGTSEESLNSILKFGFIKSKNVISAYGVGTYFSNSALIANQYANSRASKYQISTHSIRYVFIADVIISDIGINGSKIVPSCYVNFLKDPTFYCIPHNNRALPKYIVAFSETS